jgi:hypothetical protein
MGLGYFGIVGWAFALLLLWPGSTRRRTEVALALPLAIGLGAAIGLWPFVELFGHVPGLKMMFPLRYLSWVAICGAALAAFGLDRWRSALERDRRTAVRGVVVAVALGAFAVLVFFRFRERHAAAGGLVSQREALVLALTTLGAFALLGAARRRTALFAVVLAAAELVYQGTRLYRFGRAEDVAPPTPLLEFLARQPGTYRVAGEGAALFPNSNVFAGLEDVRTHDPIERRDYIEFLDAAAGYRPAEYFKALENLDAPVLDYLNVEFFVSAAGREPPGARWQTVYSGADGTVFRNRSVLDRVFAPARVEAVASSQAAAAPRRADWADRALFTLPEWRGRTRPAAGANGNAVVSRYSESANGVRFHASVAGSGPALLVTSIVDDGGWTARTAAGSDVSVGRANGPFLALLLPPGRHAVRLRYAAPGFRQGAAVSLAGFAAVALMLWLRRRSSALASAAG